MKATIISWIFTLILFVLPTVVLAQADPGGDPDVPIDGGLSLLLGAGVGYVVKKGYDKRKKNGQDNPPH